MIEAPRPGAAWMRAAIVAAALALAWRALHVNLVLYEETGRPRIAAASSPVHALEDNPAEPAALLLLAREHEAGGEIERAARAYRAALAIAPHEPEVLQLAAGFFLRRDDPLAVALLGRLAEGAARARAFAALAALAAADRHAEALARLLAARPAWSGAFLLEACRGGVDPALLARWLPRSPAGPIAPEAACAIERLGAAGRWPEAYQVWLNVLPAERLAAVGHVFNGGFEDLPLESGFDWRLQASPEREAGHAAAVLPRLGMGGRRALRVTYTGGRQRGVPVRQYLALEPGRYALEGRARHEGLKALRGVAWTVRCVEEGRAARLLAASDRFLGAAEWQRFAVELAVPEGCAGQVLQLEPAGEEGAAHFVSGVAWFDDLRLVRR